MLGASFVWAMVELAPDAILVADQAGRMIFVNRRLLSMFGYGPGELFGKRVEHLMPVRFRGQHLGHRSDYDDRPSIRPMGASDELWGLRADGTEFPAEISLSPVSTGRGMRTLAFIRDRTAQRAADHERAQSATVAAMTKAINMIYSASLKLAALPEMQSGGSERVEQAIADLDEAIVAIRNVAFATADPASSAGQPTTTGS